ncbi:MAG: magnesium transporter CorA family protein [Bacillota bacterium]|jgi:magnesium transporter
MIFTYNTIDDKLICCTDICKGCWINLINPTEPEIQQVVRETGLDYDFLKYPLDDEEIPRVEVEDEQIMIIFNIPTIEDSDIIYDTIPLGIILNDNYIVTVCLKDANLMQEITSSRTKDVATFKKTRFIFQLLHKKTTLFLKYLRDIHKHNNETEIALHKSMTNKHLIHLFNMQKSLVYFSTGLRSNAKVMERLLRSKALKMYEEDEDILEDVIIENRQAVEMADIYSNIAAAHMDAFASLVSNNLNIVMRFLTAITIVLSIPTMIASFWGMNVPVPLTANPWGFIIIIIVSVILCLAFTRLLIRKKIL